MYIKIQEHINNSTNSCLLFSVLHLCFVFSLWAFPAGRLLGDWTHHYHWTFSIIELCRDILIAIACAQSYALSRKALESEENLAYMKDLGILSLFIQRRMWIRSCWLIKLSMSRMSMRKSRVDRVDYLSTDKINNQAWNEISLPFSLLYLLKTQIFMSTLPDVWITLQE